MSKKTSSKGAAPAAAKAVLLSAPELEVSWRVLGSMLQGKDKDDVKHAAVQTLAERIFNSSVLSGSPDVDALEVLSVSLVQQSRWSALVSLLSPHAALVASRPQLSFHLAYSLYRDKQHVKCLDELRKRGASSSSAAAGGLSEGELHLQAQALYRAGQYAAAARVYRDTQLAEDDDVEMQANMLAALVSAGLMDEAKAYIKKLLVLSNPASFELAYNASCCLVESGDYAGALATVRRAEVMCREVLAADGVTDEAEVERELAGPRVQEAFILQQMSRLPGAQGDENDKALALYTKVLAAKQQDPNASSIASNNIITLRSGSSKIWDSLKKSNKAMELDLKDMTLSARQRSAIQLNRALVLLHGKQDLKCKELLADLTKEFNTNAQIALAQAAVLAKDKSRIRDAEEGLRDWIKANEAAPFEAIQSVSLGLAHLALLRGDVPAAIQGLVALSQRKASNMAHKPAMVATLVALYERNGDIEGAHATIQAAIAFWLEAGSASGADPAAARSLQRILSSAGAFYGRHGREADAAALLEFLAAQSAHAGASAASRAESVARLVLAYAHAGDAVKQAQYTAQLPPLPIPASMDVHQLESVPAPEVAKRKKKAPAAAASSASAKKATETDGDDSDLEDGEEEEEEEKEGGGLSASLAKAAARTAAKAASKLRKKKKPPTRYPKGFDPANPGPMPDPERWLPRYERSNQKRFNKRRTGNAIRGAQGSTNMANMPAKDEGTGGVESTSKMSAAAAAAARKRAGKKARPDGKDGKDGKDNKADK